MVLPFVIRSDECTIIAPFAIYGGYGAFILLSTFIELLCFMKVKNELKEDGKSQISCSSFFIAKWL